TAGLVRIAAQKGLNWINAHAADVELLCKDDNPARIRMIVPALYPLLIQCGMLKDAAALMRNGLQKLEPTIRQQVQDFVLTDAAKFLRNRDASNSLLLSRSLGEPDLVTDGRDPIAMSFNRRLARKQAQALQMLGQTKEAERILQCLVDLGDTDESVDALADL